GAASALALLLLARWRGADFPWLLAAAAASLVAAALHPVSIYLAAPAVLALAWESGRALRAGRPGAAAAALGLGSALVVGVVWLTARHAYILAAPGPSPSGYALWSPAHLLDQLNEHLLVAPLQAALTAALLGHRRRAVSSDPVLVCTAVAAAAAAAAAFAVNPALGALDWDLLAAYAVPLCFLTSLLVSRSLYGRGLVACMAPLAAASLAHAGLWLAANVAPGQAVGVVELMAARDPHQSPERRTNLGVKMQSMGYAEAAAHQYEAVLRADPDNGVALYNLALVYYTDPRWPTALGLTTLERFLEAAPDSTDTRLVRAILTLHQGRPEAALLLGAHYWLDHPPGIRRAGLREAGGRSRTHSLRPPRGCRRRGVPRRRQGRHRGGTGCSGDGALRRRPRDPPLQGPTGAADAAARPVGATGQPPWRYLWHTTTGW
ncbi:MAG: hypothetical protein ABIL09_20435, partial [Gemmatimonadota bacterium]